MRSSESYKLGQTSVRSRQEERNAAVTFSVARMVNILLPSTVPCSRRSAFMKIIVRRVRRKLSLFPWSQPSCSPSLLSRGARWEAPGHRLDGLHWISPASPEQEVPWPPPVLAQADTGDPQIQPNQSRARYLRSRSCHLLSTEPRQRPLQSKERMISSNSVFKPWLSIYILIQ